jgi:hypothetical protein
MWKFLNSRPPEFDRRLSDKPAADDCAAAGPRPLSDVGIDRGPVEFILGSRSEMSNGAIKEKGRLLAPSPQSERKQLPSVLPFYRAKPTAADLVGRFVVRFALRHQA